jgi:hypothetical protein
MVGKFNKEVDHLYFSPDDIRVIKARKMRWMGHGRRRKMPY